MRLRDCEFSSNLFSVPKQKTKQNTNKKKKQQKEML